jgi:hypothetical protein
MDHIPYPPDSILSPVRVPYLGIYEYDHLDYASFPQRKGIAKEGTLDIDLGRPSQDVAGFAQSWLFFGLISELLGQTFDTRIFVRQESDADMSAHVLLLDTNWLYTALKDWQSSIYKKLNHRSHLRRFRKTLLIALDAGEKLDELKSDDDDVAAVLLSIKVLHIYIVTYFNGTLVSMRNSGNRHVSRVWRWPPPSLPISASTWAPKPVLERQRAYHRTPAANLLISRMAQSGWCKQQTLRWCKIFDYFMIYYLSGISRQEGSGINHENCSDRRCTAYNTNSSTYKIHHTAEDCTCQMIEAPYQTVAEIVDKGGVPLVDIQIGDRNQVKLEVVEYGYGMEYTALFHVWIDGLGNPTSNALLECQLRELARDLQRVQSARPKEHVYVRMSKLLMPKPNKRPLLWIDTLCVPVQDEHKMLRLKAINRMGFIYAAASQVLVADGELDKLDPNAAPTELCHALKTCPRWNSRAWTLQEGAIASQCIFKFQLWRPLLIPPYATHGESYLIQRFYSQSKRIALFDIQISKASQHSTARQRDFQKMSRFICAWNNIGSRSTTMAADLHVILANLTDFSASQILSLESSVERTKVMLYCQQLIPLEMMYTIAERPRASQDSADRWIPAFPGPDPITDGTLLKWTNEGLELVVPSREKPPNIFAVEAGSALTHVCFSDPDRLISHKYWIKALVSDNDLMPRDTPQGVVFIFGAFETGSTALPTHIRGARLLICGSGNGRETTVFTRYDCPVAVQVSSYPPIITDGASFSSVIAKKISKESKLVIEQSK